MPKNQTTTQLSEPTILPNFVVAIGASAGGLEALEHYFSALQPNTGAAYVVIQHLSPDHKSMMHSLLARYTSMPILVVTNELKILANHVYLIPPGVIMTIHGDKLYLSPKEPHVLSLPIDLFYISLASAYGDKSIGVVLSGTGSDGTRGAVAINDAGGFVMAQEPASAAFDGMPRSVITTGIVDLILPPDELAKRTSELVQQVKPQLDKPEVSQAKLTSPMERIFQLLYEVGRINFKEYKSVTVKRRIERRMQIRGAQSIAEYLALMEKDRAEVAALKRDTLIPVTSFFRDREAFEVLENVVIPNIIHSLQSDSPIRIWVCGCATGEEAYSLAILFFEVFEKLNHWGQLKIFATDVEQHYIDIASAGVYPEAIANELSEQRLQRYFTHVNNNYVIRSEIRQKIIFAKHNVLEDPPFTRMDLVTCRNMLIYFNTDAQERALQRFQYALLAKAYFFQGSSESLGKRQNDFTTIDSKHKIYQLTRALTLPLHFKSSPISQLSAEMRKNTQTTSISDESIVIDTGERNLLASYAPPAILVNQERALIHSYGDVSEYIQIQTGNATLELSKLLLGKLSPVVIALLHKVAKEKVEVSSVVNIKSNVDLDQNENLRITVKLLKHSEYAESYYLIIFERQQLVSESSMNVTTEDLDAVSSEHIQNLERDLANTRDSLQATIEELETANEELQATNEELMAANEELQSTNEELQSVNEELYTVNSENQEKIDILNRMNVDLDNMARAVKIATIFVDENLVLRRFTTEVMSIFKLREQDIGRHIDDCKHTLDYPEFIKDLHRVMENGQVIEREVQDAQNRWYQVRINPYFNLPKKLDGVVTTFVDITTVKDAQNTQLILDTLDAHMALLNQQGVILMVNKPWRDFSEKNGAKGLYRTGVGTNYIEACASNMKPDDMEMQIVLCGIRNVLSGKEEKFTMRYPCHSPKEKRWFEMQVEKLHHPAGGALISHTNITHWMDTKG